MRSDDSSRKEFLRSIGIDHPGDVLWNATSPRLYEEVVRRREGLIAHQGPIVVKTGHHTGRSPNDKFIVQEAKSGEKIWWGDVNRPFPEENFERLFQRMLSFLRGTNLYVQDCYAGADSRYRVPVVVITEYAWHNLFARNLFIRQDDTAAVGDDPSAHPTDERPFTVIDLPRFHADPDVDGTNSQTFILVSFDRRLVLIGGTSYAGEMKKSVFTLLNYLLPQQDVLSMHCSANIGPEGDVAVFFGLSGTGKTTLSADPSRRLIGDDEHGWSDEGVFNFEGGCYAKVIRLSEEAEPQIYACTRRFGTVLENVAIDPDTRQIDLDDATLTENTRAGYPLDFIDNSVPEKRAGHPRNVIMLTCDAFGVMPPIAKLTPEQAMYHFLSGYTAKVAGTERGMGNEPTATFSTCFGAPFLALPPSVYATMLGERIEKHDVDCWLVNTGWNGGPFGVGERMKIQYTRAMVHAALDGSLAKVPMRPDPVFGVLVPQECPGVPADVLDPKSTWKDPAAYDRMAAELAHRFRENFEQFAGTVSAEVKNAGPVTQ